jgi:amino-acid N-acetyltransferase
VGKQLVARCVQRAHELGVFEVMAISANEGFLQSCGFDFSLPDQKKALFFQTRERYEKRRH